MKADEVFLYTFCGFGFLTACWMVYQILTDYERPMPKTLISLFTAIASAAAGIYRTFADNRSLPKLPEDFPNQTSGPSYPYKINYAPLTSAQTINEVRAKMGLEPLPENMIVNPLLLNMAQPPKPESKPKPAILAINPKRKIDLESP